jgi:hypothetical protein
MSKECCGVCDRKQAKFLTAQFLEDLTPLIEDHLNKGWFPAGGHVYDGTNYSVLLMMFPK